MKKVFINAQNILLAALIVAAFVQCSKNIKHDSNPETRLSINQMEADGVDKTIIKKIETILDKELKELKGDNRVVYRHRDGVSKSTNRQLIGRISKLGKNYVLSIKVVEGEKGKVLYNRTVTTKERGIDDSIEDIAEDISDEDSIWER